MIVRCVQIINTVTGSLELSSSWLTLNRQYIVLSIDYFVGRGVLFRIIGDNSPSPALFESQQFEIVKNNIPSNWLAWNDQDGNFGLKPRSWLREGFWEDYFNNVPEAIRDFEREQSIIFSESSTLD